MARSLQSFIRLADQVDAEEVEAAHQSADANGEVLLPFIGLAQKTFVKAQGDGDCHGEPEEAEKTIKKDAVVEHKGLSDARRSWGNGS